MGSVKKHSMGDYWVNDSIMNTPFPPPIMSRNMFLNILKFFHCCDEDEYIPRGEPGYDPLVKMGTVYTEIAQRFSELWTCRKHIAIDEGSIPFKGRVHFKCFNPSKPDKYNLKTFKLCDSSNGCCSQIEMYVGNEGREISDFGKTHDLVCRLAVPFANKGYSLYIDNFYSSPFLFHHLQQWSISATGTFRKRRGLQNNCTLKN